MKIAEAREQVLLDYVANVPGGAEKLATLAIAALPWSHLKTLTGGLDIEQEAQKLKTHRNH